ncbi:MAG: amidohydrolase family protein, partial [Devosia nanyangense]|nr:amidohydrolase family protein [Devosia nanyangense]
NSFYLATLGNARALGLEDRIGSIAPGRDADLVVLDSSAISHMALRMQTISGVAQELFLLQTMGDDRSVREVYIAGEAVKTRLA